MTSPPSAIAPHGTADPWAVLDALPDALVLIDAAGAVCFVNAAWRRLGQAAGFGPSPQLGEHFPPDYAAALIAAHPDYPSLPAALAAVLAGTGTSDSIVFELLPGMASYAITIAPYPVEPPAHGAVVVQHLHHSTARTLAEQRRREQRLRLESVTTLAAGVAHDFNNLLTVIIGAANLALLDHSRPSATRDALLAIQEAAERATGLTAQMLAYAGKRRMVLEPVDLNQIVTELHAVSRPAGIMFEFALDSNLPPVPADRVQIRRALDHFLANAVEAIGAAPGTITITTSLRRIEQQISTAAHPALEPAPGTYAAVEVRDSGAGMDADTLSRVFEPFFSTKFAGRGLSLAEVLGIVASHHGNVLAESVPGQGSTFTLLLPAGATPPTPQPQSVPAAAAPAAMPLVLVADDEEGVREVIGRILRRAGYRVLLAEDGARAVELFAQHAAEIACVLLDMTMPRMGGEHALTAIRQLRPDGRVVLMSGFSEQDVGRHVASGSLAGLLQKPFTPADLLALVDRATGRDQ
jgi:two-component system, cell cycle sensor histidine kinase and response regulator CckA